MQLAIDIGTHKILGLAYRIDGDSIEVLHSVYFRHPERSMRDGQIHDIRAVARLLQACTVQIEEAVGAEFTEAHVAAAGRVLQTARGKAMATHAQPIVMTDAMQQELEWEAIAHAQAALLQNLDPRERARGYYCVGHSVVNQWLEDENIGSLIDQRGRRFEMEVLATFLPGTVVNSLETALHQAGLKMAGLTLEPIAALEAVVPQNMRHLNVVLIDIGAGTSDIAITEDGAILAYDMVPQAGDKITEALAKKHLLDFSVAERLKSVSGESPYEVENILGDTVSLTPDEVEESVRDEVQSLALELASSVARWSGQPPDAVLFVGGGSQTPGLPGALAQALGIAPDRVAIRDVRKVKGYRGAGGIEGPDAITAIGIAMHEVRHKTAPPVRVEVNGHPVSLFQKERCTVLEALRAAGFSPEQIAGRLAAGITVTVNGDIVAAPGERGQEAKARVGGQSVPLDYVLHDRDEIEVEPAVPGRERDVTAEEILDRWVRSSAPRPEPVSVRVNGLPTKVPFVLRRDGRPVDPRAPVRDRDAFEAVVPDRIREVIQALGHDVGPSDATVRCRVNGELVTVRLETARYYRNGQRVQAGALVFDGDDITWESEPIGVTVRDVLNAFGVEVKEHIDVSLNGRPVQLPCTYKLRLNGAPASSADEVKEGDEVRFDPDLRRPLLYDLLPHVDLDYGREEAQERRLVLQVGGREAAFTTPLEDGDDVTVKWEGDR